MIISFKTQDINFVPDMNDLLCQIDKFLSKKAKQKLDSDRFGAKICINEDDYFLVSEYRSILIAKVSNDICLSRYSLDDIISRIKQLINRN